MQAGHIENIRDVVLPLLGGKRLLDIGCIGHDLEARRTIGTFYLEDFRRKAAYVKGIDILEEDVDRARRMGFEVEVGNAEGYTDGSNYDVIFAGELIEHLSNPGAFLRCAYQNLRDDGVLVLSTPNTFSFSRLLRCLARGTNEPPLNEEHTCYFTPRTLEQLVTRWGFRVDRLHYSDYDYGAAAMPASKTMLLWINRALCRMAPKFSQSFVVELRKIGGAG
ncbi:MAG TPA: class I SAM-dependent methyltransferase [Roseiarcus sp.]|nr:class I SAM-dependent methyltransferase [Roseiarcus sp.]